MEQIAIPRAFLNFAREYNSRSKAGGKLVVVFSTNGGVGRTTIATNLAVAIHQLTNKPVVLVDGSLPFGDVAVSLNISPGAKTIADLVGKFDALNSDVLVSTLVAHSTGIHALLAPPTPESTELITGANIGRVLELLRERYAYVVVDAWPSFQEQVIAMLDAADTILLVTTLELTSLKNTRIFLQIAGLLGYPADKVQLVANRVDRYSIRSSEAEAILGKNFVQAIGWDRPLFAQAANQAMPFVWSEPATLRAGEVRELAEKIERMWQSPAQVAPIGSSNVSLRSGRRPNRVGIFMRFALWLLPPVLTVLLWNLAGVAGLRADPLNPLFIGLFWATLVAAVGLSNHLGYHLGVYAVIRTWYSRVDDRLSRWDQER